MSDKSLNLDELFGLDRPIVVNWQKKRYELRRPQGLSPSEYVRWNKLRKEIGRAQKTLNNVFKAGAEALNEDNSAELERLLDQTIQLLNSDLINAGLTFMMKVSVLDFYMKEIDPSLAQPNGAKTEPKNSTGA